MEVMSKIFSYIMIKIAFQILDKHGTKYQSSGTPKLGCADGLFTLKKSLSMRKNHDEETFAGFADLVKDYDTEDHKLLIKVSEQYGAPTKFCSDIERMYTDLVVILKIGKSIAEISQEIGVRQGDNMAPVLFLFLMSDFAESLDAIWEENGLEKDELKQPSKEDFENGKGIIKSHKPSQYKSSKLKTTKVIQCIYVDDGVFLFKTRQQLITGMKLVQQHMDRFGLEIHIVREVNGKTKPSKT